MSVHVSPQAGPSWYRYLQQDHGNSPQHVGPQAASRYRYLQQDHGNPPHQRGRSKFYEFFCFCCILCTLLNSSFFLSDVSWAIIYCRCVYLFIVELTAYSKKSTISSAKYNLLRHILPGELTKHTISEGTKLVTSRILVGGQIDLKMDCVFSATIVPSFLLFVHHCILNLWFNLFVFAFL